MVEILAAPSVIIKLNATCEGMDTFLPELRMDLNWSIAKVKEFLERKFGISANDMRLQLRNSQGQIVGLPTDPTATLGSYNPQEGMTVHVIDESGHTLRGEFDDVSQVEKYKISEQAYAARDDTFRAFKHRMQAAGHANFQNN